VAILVVGHYCHDTLIGNAGTRRALGGSAAYASAILDALGEPHEVVAKVGRDFLYAQDVSRKPLVVGGRTTTFVDDYRGPDRSERVEAIAEAIDAADLPAGFDIGLACAVAGEIPLRTLRRLREVTRVVIADAQSILREVSADGEVILRAPPTEAFEAIDVLKASRKEADALDVAALRGKLTLLITDGPRGCALLTRVTATAIAAFDAEEKDPTGAGDCFLAGFAAGIARGLPPAAAARLGAWCGARAVEHVGVPRLDPAAVRAALRTVLPSP
jgi:1D-myo-inositol 3-kinase